MDRRGAIVAHRASSLVKGSTQKRAQQAALDGEGRYPQAALKERCGRFPGLSRMETAMYRSISLAIAMATSTASAPAQDAIEPPRQTWDCDVPLDKLAEPAPLPHFAAALKTSTTLDIVAIGSSSTFGIGASTLARPYPVQLQNILERTFKGRDFFISNSGIGGEVAAQTAKRVRN